MPEKQRFLTIGEAAQFLNVSEVSLRRWTNSGKLRCFRVGGRSERRFLIDDLLAFMSSTVREPELQSSEVAAFAEPHERHISLFFRNQDEQWQLIRPYLLEYLRAGTPVFYLQHSTSSQRLIELLHAEGLPLDDLIARGLLRILPPDQSYLLTGRFDGQRMLAFIESAILAGLAARHTRMLMTGEMTWSLPETPGAEQMMSYEAELNPLVDKYPAVTIICQYDLRRFNGVSILDALLTHPSVLVASGHASGFYGM